MVAKFDDETTYAGTNIMLFSSFEVDEVHICELVVQHASFFSPPSYDYDTYRTILSPP